MVEYHKILIDLLKEMSCTSIEALIKSAIDSIEDVWASAQETKDQDERELQPLEQKLEDTCSQFVDLFISLAPVSELEENIEKQEVCVVQLKHILSRSKSAEYERRYISYSFTLGRFPERFSDSHMHSLNRSERKDNLFFYSIKMASLPTLHFLFERISCDSFMYFNNMISEAVDCRQFDILRYLLSTLQEYIDKGTVEPLIKEYDGYANKEKITHIDPKECVYYKLIELLEAWFDDYSISVKEHEDNLMEDFLTLSDEAIKFGAAKKVS